MSEHPGALGPMFDRIQKDVAITLAVAWNRTVVPRADEPLPDTGPGCRYYTLDWPTPSLVEEIVSKLWEQARSTAGEVIHPYGDTRHSLPSTGVPPGYVEFFVLGSEAGEAARGVEDESYAPTAARLSTQAMRL